MYDLVSKKIGKKIFYKELENEDNIYLFQCENKYLNHFSSKIFEVEIPQNNILSLVQYQNYYLKVITLLGDAIIIFCESTDKIKDIKAKVSEILRLEVDEQRLVFSGLQLENDRTLEEYNIKKGSTLSVLRRLKG